MTAELVHPVSVDEIVPWSRSMVSTFLDDPDHASSFVDRWRPDWDGDRAWGARDRGRWVATLRTVPYRLTIPGGELRADGLTNVTVAGTHRRQGLLTRMLSASLATAHELGEAVSILIAAEWPIYGRFGYAPAVQSAHYTLRTGPGRPRLPGPAAGEIYQVEDDELATVAPAIFDAVRRTRPGNIDRSPWWWQRSLGLDGRPKPDLDAVNHIVHVGSDGPDGYLTWKTATAFDETAELGQIAVTELMAANPSAYLGLWNYLLNVDIVDRVQLRYRPVDEPLPWLLSDGRALRETYRGDRMWLRLLDVPTALTARDYATADRLVLEVVDPDGAGYAAGRFELDVSTDGASCRASMASPDIRLNQHALAAAFLGGSSVSAQSIAAGVDEFTAGALRRLDALLATPLAPWCATAF